ncbi:hypothetical protein P280DRAFT_467935 [Massarina eburnea CBS 473.64]|uniref:Uncharacterized protein n=1 Tax=Massarina eburnea CBS 473.64 TaxID=1395130 RepID=A0A6A6S871_9PLEO|nr:hypothetical protein P280DRAFT_467935 [Massarina eburnea CBS 473.64]
MTDVPQPSVQQLAESLSEGFAALSGEYQTLFEQQRQLECKLSWAKQQYLDLLKRFTPDTLSQDHIVFLQDLERVAEPTRSSAHWFEHLAQSDDVERKQRAELIKQAESASANLSIPPADIGVKIWSGPLADKEKPTLRLQSVDASHLEKDFTTSGTPSRLGCPFASSSARQSPLATPQSTSSRMSLKGRRSKRPSFNDPIRADICGNDAISASASASIAGSGAVCPIRFLDQHAPEDVAKYFEKHKHELPRSHEVCIGRFQTNTESIRQLDRKYGNLVSMIQGLGEKHQAWLPEEPEDAEDAPEDASKTDVKVEKWATAVTSSLHSSTPPGEEETPEVAADEVRTARFDRPLKEIRVGESPSRPWGIQIPAKYTNADSSSSVGSAPTASPPLPLEMSRPATAAAEKTGQCPFSILVRSDGSKVKEHDPATDVGVEANAEAPLSRRGQPVQPQAEAEAESELPESEPEPQHEPQHEPQPEPKAEPAEVKAERKSPEPETPKVVPQIIFNGPVFLGYPPEQLAILLQNSNLGGMGR